MRRLEQMVVVGVLAMGAGGIFLCPVFGGGACMGESRSVFDNKEGFDIAVTTAGNYRLSIVCDADASLGCNGNYGHNGGYAVAYGPTANFIEAP